jgi:glycerophosphoryl diester phosphodiesterase
VNEAPLLLGHRGLRNARIPENTLEAFEAALQSGCDGFEFDVRVTADGHAVVCHDSRSRRRAVAKNTLSELKHLALLEDVLARFSQRAFLDIELKVPGIERTVLELLVKFPPVRSCVVTSFLPDVLIELRRLSENVSLGILFDKHRTDWRHLAVEYVLPKRSLLTAKLVDEVHNSGKQIVTWTVNDRRSILRFVKWGVDGIISDKPELLVSALRTEQVVPKSKQ